MLIETSALVALMFDEAESGRMAGAILSDPIRLTGAPNVLEAYIVARARSGVGGGVALDALLEQFRIEVVPMTREATTQARMAHARYGRGVGAPAVLNFGDCMSYGLAREHGEPLLFKGDDFSRTDIPAVPY